MIQNEGAENRVESPAEERPAFGEEPKRKNSKRWIFWVLLFIVFFGGGSWLAFKFFKPSSAGPRINPLNLVPSDAFFILETEQPYRVWSKLAQTEIWKTLTKDENWRAYGEQLAETEETLASFSQVLDLLDDRSIYLSGHLYRKGNYDYLFVFDTEGMGILRTWLRSSENLTKRDFEGVTIYEKLNKETKETLYFTFIDNFLIGSFTHKLVEQSISEHQEASFARSFDFIEVQKQTLGEGVVRLFLNYETLYPYLVSSLGPDYTEVIKENLPLFHSGFYFDVEESILLLEGYSNYNDSLATYLQLFEKSGTGGMDIAEVLPSHTSIYFSLGFDAFGEFYELLDRQLRADAAYGEEYRTYTKKTEKFLNISLKEDFASWIDDEIAVAQIEPEEGISNIALILKGKSAQIADEKMSFLTRQIKRKTPVKFKAVNYRGYEINFMSVKGFFKLILGKLFTYFDRPYYTIIDKYVVFANEPKVLSQFIDDYLANNTLGSNIAFRVFTKQLGEDHSALIYLQLPLLVNTQGGMLDDETVALLKSKRNVVKDFPQLAFSFSPSKNMYQSRALVSINNIVLSETETAASVVPDTINYDSLFTAVVIEEQVEITEIDVELEDLGAKSQSENFEDGTQKYEVGVKNGLKHGLYFEYYPSGELKVKGKYKNDLKEGLWKYYMENGDLDRKEKYRKGTLID